MKMLLLHPLFPIFLVTQCSLYFALTSAVPYTNFRGFETVKRQAVSLASSSSDPLTVDLGYSVYQGYNNATLDLNIWKG